MSEEEKEIFIKDLVKGLLGSFTQVPHDPSTFARALISALSTRDLCLVYELCHPKTGIAAKSKYIPSIAECLAWCDDLEVKRWRENAPPAMPRLPQIEKPVCSEEERERVGQMFERLREELRSGPNLKTMN